MRNHRPRTAVVWRTGALGDFVLTLPVLHAVADRVRHLAVVAPGAYRPLFPRADRWIDADGPVATRLYAGARLEADVGVAWSALAAEAMRAARVREVLLGRPMPPEGVHQADNLWAPVADWLGPRDRDPALAPRRPSPMERWRGAVVFAPGSGGARKRWPLASWRAVAETVERAVWVAGPLERDEPGWGAPRVEGLELPDLVDLAAVCRAWLGPDAGPQHLAAAAGARVGAVFVGASDPVRWAPLGARVFTCPRPAEVAAWIRSG